MDAMEVAAALRGAAERGGGCVLAAIRNGWESCLDESCVECAAESVRWFSEAADAIERCALPEGVSWPRFEDGEPVRVGDEFMGKDGKTYTVQQVQFIGKCFSLYDFCDRKPQFNSFYGERVKRPAPKVLDADGAEIRVGDVLYRKSDGHMVKVAEVYEKTFTDAEDYVRPGDWFTHRAPVLAADGKPLEAGQTVYVVSSGHGPFHIDSVESDGAVTGWSSSIGSLLCTDPTNLTHQRPVLDADGVPIKVGDTVYHVNTGIEYSVRSVTNGGAHLSKGDKPGGYCRAEYLTHERPDSWERLEEDARELDISLDGENTSDYPRMSCVRDLVRRAKALAGRDAE